MNKSEFMSRLERSLKGLSREDRDMILADFEEHFRNSIEEGKSEEETAEMLGNPVSIGRVAKTELLVEQAEKKGNAKTVFRAVLASAGLGLFNIIIVLGPFLGIVGLLAGLWAAALGITVGGIGSIFALWAVPFLRGFFGLGAAAAGFTVLAGIGLTALGGLFGIGMFYISKWFGKLILAYAKVTVRIVKGRS